MLLIGFYELANYSRLPITGTLANSNLAVTRTKVDFPWTYFIHLLHEGERLWERYGGGGETPYMEGGGMLVGSSSLLGV